jgi:SseB protein C-terminal domain
LTSSPARQRAPEELYIQEPKFVSEQDGPDERVLKRRLADAFERGPAVQRAYLARMADGATLNVVLALRAKPEFEQALVKQVASIFASIFGAKEHLDVVFLTDALELVLKKVCRSFFETSSPG